MQFDNLSHWFHTATLLGQPLPGICAAVGAAILAYALMRLGMRMALAQLGRTAKRTSTRADDVLLSVLSGTSPWLMALASVLIGLNMLDLPDRWALRVGQLWFLAVVLQVALWANRGIQIAMQGPSLGEQPAAGATRSAAGTLIGWGLRTLLWSVVLLAMLSNLGVNVTAFIASLGVGGIAVALAAQNVLGDLFASVAIAADKPFEVGDFIVFGAVAGTVEHVGVKTTRIRSLGGEQIVMANTELLKQTVSNYKRLRERRIVFGFGVDYDTTAAQAEEICTIVRSAIESSARLRFDRVHLKGFSQNALDYEVVYIVKDPGYNVYMDEQQRINLQLMRALEERGIAFAAPRSSIRVTSTAHVPAGRPQPGRGAPASASLREMRPEGAAV